MRLFKHWRYGLVLALVLGIVVVLALDSRSSRTSPAFDLPGFGHQKGRPDAAIVIIEFTDFGCSACAQFARQTLPLIQREWIATGRARMRMIPFDALKTGRSAAQAAECAARQDAFWSMHDLLFARHKEWLGRRGQREIFHTWAAELGLNVAQFRACYDSDPGMKWLERNSELARMHGVPGTPAFVVNGQPLVGALPYPAFANALANATGTPK
ncbi:MAG: DsbA family protein [Longimicrobiales bacterium]